MEGLSIKITHELFMNVYISKPLKFAASKAIEYLVIGLRHK